MTPKEKIALLYVFTLSPGEPEHDHEFRLILKSINCGFYYHYSPFVNWPEYYEAFTLTSEGIEMFEELNKLSTDRNELDKYFEKLSKRQKESYADLYIDIDDQFFLMEISTGHGIMDKVAIDFEKFLDETTYDKFKFTIPSFVFPSSRSDDDLTKYKESSLSFYVEDKKGNRLSIEEIVDIFDKALLNFPNAKKLTQVSEKINKLETENLEMLNKFSSLIKNLSVEEQNTLLKQCINQAKPKP